MAKAQLSLIILIALLLAGDLVITHVWPQFLLMKHEDEYFQLAANCATVSSDLQELELAQSEYDVETYFVLHRSAKVALMDCYGEKRLRLYLLGHRVSEHDLHRLSLQASKDSFSSVEYFTDQLREY